MKRMVRFWLTPAAAVIILLAGRVPALATLPPCSQLQNLTFSCSIAQTREFNGTVGKDGNISSIVATIVFTNSTTPTATLTSIQNKNGTSKSNPPLTGGTCTFDTSTSIGQIDFTGNFALDFVITNGGAALRFINDTATETSDNNATVGTCKE